MFKKISEKVLTFRVTKYIMQLQRSQSNIMQAFNICALYFCRRLLDRTMIFIGEKEKALTVKSERDVAESGVLVNTAHCSAK